MFLSVHVKNFKSLINFRIDLAERKNSSKHLALIYGENGSGKTNVVSIFHSLIETLHTMGFKKFFEDILAHEDFKESPPKLMKLLHSRFKDLETIIKENKTIGTKENLCLKFEFQIDGNIGIYTLEFDEEKVIHEKLEYLIEKNRGVFFELTADSNYFSPKMFNSKEYLEEISSQAKKFWGKHTLISILMFEIGEKNEKYFRDNVNTNLQDVLKFFNTLACKVNDGSRGEHGFYAMNLPLDGNFLEGEVESSNANELDKVEEILTNIFSGLYSDIKRLYYIKERIDDQNVKYELYVKKMIGSKVRDIPFKLESTGTLKILELLPPLLMAMQGNTVILDEFDAGIHDILIKSIFEELSESLEGQLIMTTHNTLLLESDVENKHLYILKVDMDGNKEIHSLDKYDLRAHKNNNRRSQYLKGMYDGIPLVGYLDFSMVADQLRNPD